MIHTVPKPVAPPEDKFARRPSKQIPRSLIEVARVIEKEDFDAEKHVDFVPPGKVYTMEELGLGGIGISPAGVSEPFPLFTEGAIRQMRGELFSKRVLEKHQYASSFSSNMIRGHCPKDAPFTTSAWNDPTVLDAISQVAGIELVPCWSYDTGHTNISINFDQIEGENSPNPDTSSVAAFNWHYDSVPFVCVTMISDCTGMIGGETMIKTGFGTYMKVRGPNMGTAVVMQGRYIQHQALKALGGRERISMVTSLRPKCPLVRDESVLTGVRGISDVPELYYQYASYRLQNLEERVREEHKKVTRRHSSGNDFDLHAIRKFLMEQREYLDATLEELIEFE